jgi:hypothetical protein
VPVQVLYDLVTGAIVGEQNASSVELLAAQSVPTGTGAVLVEAGMGIDEREGWVVADGVLVAKTQAVVVADTNPFAADGVTVCGVTLHPFVPCMLLVNGTPYALTEEDPTLEITSDVAMTFAISLAWHPTHWAAPLTVIAEEP